MAKLIPNGTDATTAFPAKASNQGQKTGLLGVSLDTIKTNVQRMAAQQFPNYLAKNSASAYCLYIRDLVKGFTMLDGAGASTSWGPHEILDGFTTPEMKADLEKYIVLYANILLTNLRGDSDSTKFTMSFISLNDNATYQGEGNISRWNLNMRQLSRDIWPSAGTDVTDERICVICYGNQPVAYYAPELIGIYPFNTIKTTVDPSPDVSEGASYPIHPMKLFGVSSTKRNGYHYWDFSLADFLDDFAVALGTLRDKNVAAFFYEVTQIATRAGNPNLAIKELEIALQNHNIIGTYAIPANVNNNPQRDCRTPLKIGHYVDGGVRVNKLQLNLPASNAFTPLLLPCTETTVLQSNGNASFDYFAALSESDKLPELNCLKTNDVLHTNLFVMAEECFSFYYNGTPIDPRNGLKISKTTLGKGISVSVRYINGTDLGTLNLNVSNFYGVINEIELIYDSKTNTIRYYDAAIEPPHSPIVVLEPFTRNLLVDEREAAFIPISRNCCELFESAGYVATLSRLEDISTLTGTICYEVEIDVQRPGGESFTMCKKYFGNNVIDCTQMGIFIPELWMYPFVKFVPNILQKAYLTAYNPSDYTEFDRFTIEISGETGFKKIHPHRQKALAGELEARFYDLPGGIPNLLYFTHPQFGDVGCTKHTSTFAIASKVLNGTTPAKVGLDMGSRNSVSICSVGGNVSHEFHPNVNGKSIYCRLNSEVCVDPGTMEELKLALAHEIFLSVKPTNATNFVSTVIGFEVDGNAFNTNAAPNQLQPFLNGRIMTGIDNSVMDKIFKLARANGINQWRDLGIFRDFKANILATAAIGLHGANALFLMDAMYHMTLNALIKGCSDIDLYLSSPTQDHIGAMRNASVDILPSLNSSFDINVVKIHAKNPILESVALYETAKSFAAVASQYTIVIDAGDSTFDVSLIYHNTNVATGIVGQQLHRAFSIRYGGRKLLVESLVHALSKNDPDIKEFCMLWGEETSESINVVIEVANELYTERAAGEFDSPVWDSPMTRDALYRLIEGKNTAFNIPKGRSANLKYQLIWGKVMPHGSEPTASDSTNAIQKAKLMYSQISTQIQVKYRYLLVTIMTELKQHIDIQPGMPSTVQVLLYGGTNNIAKMLWDNQEEMAVWLQPFAVNNNVVFNVQYKMKPAKTDLVCGLINADNLSPLKTGFDHDPKLTYSTEDYCDDVNMLLSNGDSSQFITYIDGMRDQNTQNRKVGVFLNYANPTDSITTLGAVGLAIEDVFGVSDDVTEIAMKKLTSLLFIDDYLNQ